MNYEIPISEKDRLNFALDLAWNIFFEMVVSGRIKINKESSMQLHYSSIIKQMGELICILPNDLFTIELESDVGGKNVDIICILGKTKAAAELKCFREKSNRAIDTDMYDVLKDIERLQSYRSCQIKKFLCLTDRKIYAFGKHSGHAESVSIRDGKSYRKGETIYPSWIGKWKIKNKDKPIKFSKDVRFSWVEKDEWYYLKMDL